MNDLTRSLLATLDGDEEARAELAAALRRRGGDPAAAVTTLARLALDIDPARVRAAARLIHEAKVDPWIAERLDTIMSMVRARGLVNGLTVFRDIRWMNEALTSGVVVLNLWHEQCESRHDVGVSIDVARLGDDAYLEKRVTHGLWLFERECCAARWRHIRCGTRDDALMALSITLEVVGTGERLEGIRPGGHYWGMSPDPARRLNYSGQRREDIEAVRHLLRVRFAQVYLWYGEEWVKVQLDPDWAARPVWRGEADDD